MCSHVELSSDKIAIATITLLVESVMPLASAIDEPVDCFQEKLISLKIQPVHSSVLGYKHPITFSVLVKNVKEN